MGTSPTTSFKEFTSPTKCTRPRKLLKLNLVLRTPPASPLVLVTLIVLRVPLIRASMLFTFKTWEVTWLGQKGRRVLIPLFIFINPTGRFETRCMERVVLFCVLLLTPARTVLATLTRLRKAWARPVVLRLATVLIISSILLGRTVAPTLVSLVTTPGLTRRWFVALITMALMFLVPVCLIFR